MIIILHDCSMNWSALRDKQASSDCYVDAPRYGLLLLHEDASIERQVEELHAHLDCLAIHGSQDVARPHAFPIDHVLAGCNDEVDLHQQSSLVITPHEKVSKMRQSMPLVGRPHTISLQPRRRRLFGRPLAD